MNNYEEKQKERRNRYLDRAGSARQESSRRGNEAMRMSRIMQGEPIKIGHHSEKRHRRDIERMDANMGRAVKASEKAQHYENKAAGVGKGGISQDDPDALDKLRTKISDLEKRQDFMKQVNKQFRAGGWNAVEGLSEGSVARLKQTMIDAPYIKKPFETYSLTNNSANIRRIKERIITLERAQQEPERAPVRGPGFTVIESKDENRILFEFDKKPAREVCQIMRSNGWRFSRRLMAWVRLINNTSRFSAERVTSQLEGMTLTS